MGYDFTVRVAEVTKQTDIEAYFIKMVVGRQSFMGEKPKEVLDFIGAFGFPDFLENRGTNMVYLNLQLRVAMILYMFAMVNRPLLENL